MHSTVRLFSEKIIGEV